MECCNPDQAIQKTKYLKQRTIIYLFFLLFVLNNLQIIHSVLYILIKLLN